MADSDRKQNAGKERRASGRGRSSGRRKRQRSPAGAQPRSEPRSPQAKKRRAGAKAGDGASSSSLLRTTGGEIQELLEVADDAVKKIREADQASSPRGVHEAPDGAEISALVARTRWEARRALKSADLAAEKIREEAQADAMQLLDASRRRAEKVTGEQIDRVSTATDQVLEELSDLRRQVQALRNAFDAAVETMHADLEVEQAGAGEEKRDHAEADDEQAGPRRRQGRPGQKAPAPEERERISEGARLLALQQMIEGEDAAAIEARLKKQFGIEDPKPITEWLGLPAEKTGRHRKR
jgi:hypothetical protein